MFPMNIDFFYLILTEKTEFCTQNKQNVYILKSATYRV